MKVQKKQTNGRNFRSLLTLEYKKEDKVNFGEEKNQKAGVSQLA